MKFKEGELIRVKAGAIPGGPGTANMVGDGIGLIGIVVGRMKHKTGAVRYYVHLQSGQNNIYYYASWLERAKKC